MVAGNACPRDFEGGTSSEKAKLYPHVVTEVMDEGVEEVRRKVVTIELATLRDFGHHARLLVPDCGAPRGHGLIYRFCLSNYQL
jgi:hypothetical protein